MVTTCGLRGAKKVSGRMWKLQAYIYANNKTTYHSYSKKDVRKAKYSMEITASSQKNTIDQILRMTPYIR